MENKIRITETNETKNQNEEIAAMTEDRVHDERIEKRFEVGSWQKTKGIPSDH